MPDFHNPFICWYVINFVRYWAYVSQLWEFFYLFWNIFLFIQFCNPAAIASPSFPPSIPNLLSALQPSTHHSFQFLFRGRQSFYRYQPNMAYQDEGWTKPPNIIIKVSKADKGVRESTSSHCSESHKMTKLHNCHIYAKGLGQLHVRFLIVGSVYVSSYEPSLADSVDFFLCHPRLFWLFRILPPHLLQEPPRFTLAVGLCICFHTLLDKASNLKNFKIWKF